MCFRKALLNLCTFHTLGKCRLYNLKSPQGAMTHYVRPLGAPFGSSPLRSGGDFLDFAVGTEGAFDLKR